MKPIKHIIKTFMLREVAHKNCGGGGNKDNIVSL